MAEELKERKAFEAHMRVGGHSNHDKHPDGSYVSSAMELWWQGWKARAQLPRQGGEAVEVVGYHNQISKDWSYVGRVGWEPLMTVAQHQRILAASVGSAEPVAWRVTGRDGLTVTAQYPEWAEADCLLTITPLYTHPADQVADDLTMVKVSRELLEELRDAANEARNEAERPYRISFFSALVGKADALLNGGRS